MDITEVRVKLMGDSEDRLRAFCSITFDNCFVVRDLKIIEGSQGPFVAMPSRKLTARCNRCNCKNSIRSNYCNNCGSKMRNQRSSRDEDSPSKLYADVAHPINQACRDMIQQHVVQEYEIELERAKMPGYVSRYDDGYDSYDEGNSKTAEPSYSAKSNPEESPTGPVPPPHLKQAKQSEQGSSNATERQEHRMHSPHQSPSAGTHGSASTGEKNPNKSDNSGTNQQ